MHLTSLTLLLKTTTMLPKIDFEVLLDDSFERLCPSAKDVQSTNENLLSLINDYEEGEWRYAKFSRFVWDNIAEAALSFDERQKLATKALTQLEESAKNLRLSEDKGKGGELAEILLYGIMKYHYKAISVVPKIYYKQNTQDYVKGADSVHIVLNGDKTFSLWLGEAKFYKDIASAMSEAIISIKNALQKDKLEKESSIITGIQGLDKVIEDSAIVECIRMLLSPDTSIDRLKPLLHIPILLLYQCEITRNETLLTEEYKEKIKDAHKIQATSYFDKHVKELETTIHLYSQITFHLILFPVPDSKRIKDEFIDKAESYRK